VYMTHWPHGDGFHPVSCTHLYDHHVVIILWHVHLYMLSSCVIFTCIWSPCGHRPVSCLPLYDYHVVIILCHLLTIILIYHILKPYCYKRELHCRWRHLRKSFAFTGENQESVLSKGETKWLTLQIKSFDPDQSFLKLSQPFNAPINV